MRSTIGLGILSSTVVVVFLIAQSRRSKKEKNNDLEREGNEVNEEAGIKVTDPEVPSHLKREALKEQRRREKVKFLAMKTPMYDNIHMLDPEGNHMCNISLKKAKWYVLKELAEWTSEHDIKLKFEPKARGEGMEKVFSTALKKNQCVSCGEEGHHMRHYVVPYAVRIVLNFLFFAHRFPTRSNSTATSSPIDSSLIYRTTS